MKSLPSVVRLLFHLAVVGLMAAGSPCLAAHADSVPGATGANAAIHLPLVSRSANGPVSATWRDLVYAEVEGQPLELDLYAPQRTDGAAPLVIWLHGGGWRSGDKADVPAGVLRLLADGIAVASINYRLTGDTRFADRTFPAQLHDVKGAVRFLRGHAAEYHLDPARFAVWGGSAGGHLAALLGLSCGDATLEGSVGGNLDQSSCVSATVDFFGPAQFETLTGVHELPNAPEAALLGAPLGEIKAHRADPAPPWPELVARMLAAGPVHHVSAGDPPVFIAHGLRDRLVPSEQSASLARALRAAGVAVTYHPVPGAGHEFGAMPVEQARSFLRRALSQASPVAPDTIGLHPAYRPVPASAPMPRPIQPPGLAVVR